MRLGLIARADRTGLAVQTWSFWRNMNPEKTLVVDLEYCSGKSPDLTLYPGAEVWKTRTYPYTYSEPDEQIDAFLDGLDVVFTAETPYNYWLFERARERGVRTVLQYNYEFLEYLVAPTLPKPDLFAAPSPWHLEVVQNGVGEGRTIHLPVPVDREMLEKSGALRRRESLETIIHPVGNPATEDRNGTITLLDAITLTRVPIQVEVLAQREAVPQKVRRRVGKDSRIKYSTKGVRDYWDNYDARHDLCILPRRFGGLCLPMNESLALGIPVLMSDCSPNDQILPREALVKARRGKMIQTRATLRLHNVDPRLLARRIEELYKNPAALAAMSDWALEWAEANSWDTMRSRYEETLYAS